MDGLTQTTNVDLTIGGATDTTAPVITLSGTSPVTVEVGSIYVDAGATALDETDGDRTANIVTVNPVNSNVVGPYTVTYNVSDVAGNTATQVTRTVNVVDTIVPVVVLTAPTIVSPLDNSYTTSADLTKVDWTDVEDGTAPITYIYSVSSSDATNPDGTFVTPLYTSGTLTDSEIPTPGTPE